MKCAVLTCSNSFQNNPNGVSFHGFPVEVESLHAWVAFTQRHSFIPNSNSKICSAHFDKDDYVSNVGKKLKPKANPSILPKHNKEEDCTIIDRDKKNIVSDKRSDFLSFISNQANKAQLRGIQNDLNNSGSTVGPSSVVSQSQNAVTFISTASNSYAHPTFSTNNAIVLNYNRSIESIPMQINVPIKLFPMQGMPMHKAPILCKNSIPSPLQHTKQSAIRVQNKTQPQKGPIKVVDMKKLLQNPTEDYLNGNSLSTSNAQNSNFRRQKEIKTAITPVSSKPENFNMTNIIPSTFSSKVTISQILTCLKTILPVKFDLSKLVANDKVTTLVMKYLKLNDDEDIKNTVTSYLKVIVDTAKVKSRTFGDEVNHPYHKINDSALQLALNNVFPSNFSLGDVSKEVLNCLCFVLNLDIFSDGDHIIRRKLRKFTCEGQKFSEIINKDSNSEASHYKNISNSSFDSIPYSSINKQDKTQITGKNVPKSNLLNNSKEPKKYIKVKKPNLTKLKVSASSGNKILNNSRALCTKTTTKTTTNTKRLPTFKSKLSNYKPQYKITEIPDDKKDKDYTPSSDCESFSSVENLIDTAKDKDWDYKTEGEKKSNKPKFVAYKNSSRTPKCSWLGLHKMEAIIEYLEQEKCSAKDVLVNFRLMFHLCRYLHIRSKHSNLQLLKKALQLIEERHLKGNNLKEVLQELYPDEIINCKPLKAKDSKFTGMDKLKLKPVVVLNNIIDYRQKDVLIKERSLKSNGYYNQRIPLCFQKNTPVQKFSTDHVKQLSFESYKMFRQIIAKRTGIKVAFQLKYKKLNPGSSVFVKDFRNPAVGWVKGTVNKAEGPLKYLVELDNGEKWSCVPDQIRPCPDNDLHNQSPRNPRTPRLVKPKQLFDL